MKKVQKFVAECGDVNWHNEESYAGRHWVGNMVCGHWEYDKKTKPTRKQKSRSTMKPGSFQSGQKIHVKITATQKKQLIALLENNNFDKAINLIEILKKKSTANIVSAYFDMPFELWGDDIINISFSNGKHSRIKARDDESYDEFLDRIFDTLKQKYNIDKKHVHYSIQD